MAAEVAEVEVVAQVEQKIVWVVAEGEVELVAKESIAPIVFHQLSTSSSELEVLQELEEVLPMVLQVEPVEIRLLPATTPILQSLVFYAWPEAAEVVKAAEFLYMLSVAGVEVLLVLELLELGLAQLPEDYRHRVLSLMQLAGRAASVRTARRMSVEPNGAVEVVAVVVMTGEIIELAGVACTVAEAEVLVEFCGDRLLHRLMLIQVSPEEQAVDTLAVILRRHHTAAARQDPAEERLVEMEVQELML